MSSKAKKGLQTLIKMSINFKIQTDKQKNKHIMSNRKGRCGILTLGTCTCFAQITHTFYVSAVLYQNTLES